LTINIAGGIKNKMDISAVTTNSA